MVKKEILALFKSRYNEIKKLRKKWNLESIERNEIDYIFSRLFDQAWLNNIEWTWILYVEENWTYKKVFEEWDIDEKTINQLKEKYDLLSNKDIEKIEEMKELIISEEERKKQKKIESENKKNRKEEIKNWKDKFIMNMFNQIQMSINLWKTKFVDFNYKEYDKSEYFEFIDSLPENIKVFIYNLSYKEWEMYLRNKYKNHITYVHKHIWKIIEKAKECKDFENREWQKKLIIFHYEKKTNTLFLLTPFSVKNNMWSYFECFWTTIDTQYLKFNYYRINWFKLLLINSWKDIECYFTPENINELFDNKNEFIKNYYIELEDNYETEE